MSSGDQEALNLADECANFDASIYRDVAHANAGMLAKLQDAADEIRRIVAEREADRAAMREALEALKYHTEQTRPITATQVAIHSLQKRLSPPSQA